MNMPAPANPPAAPKSTVVSIHDSYHDAESRAGLTGRIEHVIDEQLALGRELISSSSNVVLSESGIWHHIFDLVFVTRRRTHRTITTNPE